jgi:hypothetical protein
LFCLNYVANALRSDGNKPLFQLTLGYNEWRKHCGLSEPSNQAELAQVLNNTDLATRFLKLYGTPSNIDVWVGGAAEPFVQGGRVGPLFSCLITNQFKESRQGDRYAGRHARTGLTE